MPRLDWIGKDKVENYHDKVVFHTLEKQYTFNSDKESDNKIIHADNLIALKSLLPQYEGKIKCIYIDPPYNTGEEKWKYNDNVNDPRIKKWLGEAVGKQGEDLSRDDKWLCMMYPRLKLLQKLLSNDGVIFISIDDNEQANLKLICDEIFGARNFIGTLTWESTTQPINAGAAKYRLQQKCEYILLYSKQGKKDFILQTIDANLKYPHNGQFGKCRFEIIEKSDAGSYQRDSMKFPILGQFPREGKRWQIGKEKANELLSKGRLEIVDGIVKKAVYPEDELAKLKFEPFWSHLSSENGTAQQGKELLNTVMGRAVGFDTVKPVKLIEKLLAYLDKDVIILDSFAGSGTTAQAVLKLNKEDGGNRKFILVEMMDYAENITAERVKRVIKGYKDVEGLEGDFSYYELGKPMFKDEENLNEEVGEEKIRQYIYYSETKQPLTREQDKEKKYLLDNYNYTGYYFYYEKDSLTTLSLESFANIIKDKQESYIIYADICTLSEEVKKKYHIVFKKIPRDIRRF